MQVIWVKMYLMYLENPRKRKKSEEEIDLFLNVVDFAKESQKALSSVLMRDGRVIIDELLEVNLPIISPNGLSERFVPDANGFIYVVTRDSYKKFKEKLSNFNAVRYRGLYVYGPIGIGKSFTLYTLAAELRLNDKFRVTYINNCADWRNNEYEYILKELVMTFYEDKIQEKSIIQWCDEIMGNTQKGDKNLMIMLINTLIRYTCEKNFEWVLIFDQHNGLFNPPVFKDFPFSIISTIGFSRGNHIKIIISASANNEGFPTEMKDWEVYDLASHQYIDKEFNQWCAHFSIDPKSDDAIDAFYWSGLMLHMF